MPRLTRLASLLIRLVPPALVAVAALALAWPLAGGAASVSEATPSGRQYDNPVEREKPVRIETTHRSTTVWVDSARCAGFAPSPLALQGQFTSHYEYFGNVSYLEQEGWAAINVSATAAGHRYRLQQRYEFPRMYNAYLEYGFADTEIRRDDGAAIHGRGTFLWNDVTGADWVILNAPITCDAPRH